MALLWHQVLFTWCFFNVLLYKSKEDIIVMKDKEIVILLEIIANKIDTLTAIVKNNIIRQLANKKEDEK